MRMETDPVSEKLCSLVFRMDKVQKLRNSENKKDLKRIQEVRGQDILFT
jgi:hypothetical protein